MAESYAGITVPPGNPDTLRGAASSFAGVSGALERAAGQLAAMPGSIDLWRGPASVSYAGSCQTSSGSARQGVQAMHAASNAARRYAMDLEQAQHEARRAIELARDAHRRIDHAKAAIAAAQDAAAAAAVREVAATTEIAVTSAAGAPSVSALADQARAQSDGSDAAAAESRAQTELSDAQGDLERAKTRGGQAEQHARDAASAAAGALGQAGGGLGAVGQPGAPATAEGGGGEPPTWLTLLGGAGFGTDAAARTVEQGGGLGNVFTKTAVSGYTRGGGRVSGYWRTTPSGGSTWVKPYYRQGGAVSGYLRNNPTSLRWARLGKFARGAGYGVSFLTAGASQWAEDSENPNLTTTDRVGRTGGAAAAVGGGAAAGGWAGAEAGGMAGAAIGTAILPIGGTAVGGAIGALAGGIGGSYVGEKIGEAIKQPVMDLGQGLANGAVDTGTTIAHGVDEGWDATAGVRHKIGSVLDDINPF